MVIVVKKSDVRFRIQIYDLKAHKSRTVSLADGQTKLTVEDIKKKIEECFERK